MELNQPDGDLVGKRLELKQKFGAVRYFGKLINNPKAGDDF